MLKKFIETIITGDLPKGTDLKVLERLYLKKNLGEDRRAIADYVNLTGEAHPIYAERRTRKDDLKEIVYSAGIYTLEKRISL